MAAPTRSNMSKKSSKQASAPTVSDIARIKRGFDTKTGGKAPLPQHIRRMEKVANKREVQQIAKPAPGPGKVGS